MSTSIIGRQFDTGLPVELEISDDRIRSVRVSTCLDSRAIDQIPFIAPALVDLQVNGLLGRDFSSLGVVPEDIAFVTRELRRHGVAGYCPTLVTGDFESTQHGLRTIATACRIFPAVSAAVLGIHLEGPYISPLDGPRGAHAAEHCRPPDWDEFQRLQEAASGRIRIVTLAPEYDSAPDFIRRAVASGVLIALGHTSATSDQIQAAVVAGARLSTHLGNGAHALLPRHPNYIWDQLANDRLWASLIADGIHLPDSTLKSLVRAKEIRRCLLVSDLAPSAGLPPGRYESQLGRTDVLADGRLVVAGQAEYLAGASSHLELGVRNVMRILGIGLASAIEMASRRPLELLGLPAWGLIAGSPANISLIDPSNERCIQNWIRCWEPSQVDE